MYGIEGFGDYIRILVILGNVTILTLMIIRLLRIWTRYSFSQKCIFAAVFFYNLGMAGRLTELILLDLPFSFWLLSLLAGNTCMVIFLWEPTHKYEERLGMDMRNPPPKDL